MLIDDLITDAKVYVENHLEIIGANNLPEMEIQRQFLEYAYQEIDCPSRQSIARWQLRADPHNFGDDLD